MNTACTGGSPSAGIVEVGLERVELVAERVAAHDDVEPAEGLLARRSRRARVSASMIRPAQVP